MLKLAILVAVIAAPISASAQYSNRPTIVDSSGEHWSPQQLYEQQQSDMEDLQRRQQDLENRLRNQEQEQEFYGYRSGPNRRYNPLDRD